MCYPQDKINKNRLQLVAVVLQHMSQVELPHFNDNQIHVAYIH